MRMRIRIGRKENNNDRKKDSLKNARSCSKESLRRKVKSESLKKVIN